MEKKQAANISLAAGLGTHVPTGGTGNTG